MDEAARSEKEATHSGSFGFGERVAPRTDFDRFVGKHVLVEVANSPNPVELGLLVRVTSERLLMSPVLRRMTDKGPRYTMGVERCLIDQGAVVKVLCLTEDSFRLYVDSHLHGPLLPYVGSWITVGEDGYQHTGKLAYLDPGASRGRLQPFVGKGGSRSSALIKDRCIEFQYEFPQVVTLKEEHLPKIIASFKQSK